eukprot:scaffold10270_cov193-Alexandrium_tamarense.AAC.23
MSCVGSGLRFIRSTQERQQANNNNAVESEGAPLREKESLNASEVPNELKNSVSSRPSPVEPLYDRDTQIGGLECISVGRYRLWLRDSFGTRVHIISDAPRRFT